MRVLKETERMSAVRDGWGAASAYEEFMGRWSRQLASQFVSWLRIPPDTHWLDVGCGTGACTNAICTLAHPASVVGCDPAPSFVEYARDRCADVRVSFVVGEVGELPGRTGGYGSITSLLALNFFPDPAAALGEMRSLAAPEGMISACVWDYGEGMEFLRYFWDTAAALDPAAALLDEGKRFPLCRPGPLLELFRGAGLKDVRCEELKILTAFATFDEYWQPLLGGTGPAPSYVASLGTDRKGSLARELERVLPRGTDGSIPLTARAWGVRGRVGGENAI